MTLRRKDRTEEDERKLLEKFASRVERAAVKVATGPARQTGTFHGANVFIHAVWAVGNFDMELDEFKQLLVEAHRKGLVELSRADLVEAMDKHAVKRSTTQHPFAPNVWYNFVVLDSNKYGD